MHALAYIFIVHIYCIYGCTEETKHPQSETKQGKAMQQQVVKRAERMEKQTDKQTTETPKIEAKHRTTQCDRYGVHHGNETFRTCLFNCCVVCHCCRLQFHIRMCVLLCSNHSERASKQANTHKHRYMIIE